MKTYQNKLKSFTRAKLTVEQYAELWQKIAIDYEITQIIACT